MIVCLQYFLLLYSVLIVDCASSAGNCMEGLMHLLYCTTKDKVIDEAVVALRQLLQQNVDHSPENINTNINIIHRLVKMLISDEEDDSAHVLKMPVARASVVWLVGESYSYLEDISPDILRILASKFADEATQTKTQIANFAVKLGARLPDDVSIQGLMTYVLEMARYDVDIDLRDRTRFMTAMMGLTSLSVNQGDVTGSGERRTVESEAANLTELSSHSMKILLASKLPPVTLHQPTLLEDVPDFEIGSLSAMVGHSADGYVPIPNWPETQLQPHVREEATKTKSSEKSPTSHNLKHDIETDDFYGDTEFSGGGRGAKASKAAKNKVLSESESSSESSNSTSADSSDEESDSESESNGSSSGDSGDETDQSSSSSDEDDMFMTTKARTKKVSTATPLSSVRRLEISNHSSNVGNESDILIPMSPQALHSNVKETVSGISAVDFMNTPSTTGSEVNFLDSGTMESHQVSQPPVQNSLSHLNSDSDILLQMFESFPSTKDASGVGAKYLTDVSNSATAGNSFSSPLSNVKVTARQSIELTTSVPKILLRPELSSGLQATFRFRHGVNPSLIPGSNCGFIELKNCNSDGFLRYLYIH